VVRRSLEAAVVVAVLTVAHPARAQFAASALYEIGGARTGVGEDDGKTLPAYALGLGASYSLFPKKALGLAVGGDALVRGFGIEVADRVERSAGVFAQSDLVLDEWIAVRTSRILAGVYFEQRRLDRGTALGVIGSPASAIGGLLEARLAAGGRTRARFSYARYRAGRLRLAGSDVEPKVDSGWSLRASLRHRLTTRWGLQAEYTGTRLELEDVAPTFAFLAHRQSTFSLGAFVSL
jgi:hypothetical protein